MSWSEFFKDVPGAEVHALDHQNEHTTSTSEMARQFVEAKWVAQDLIDMGVVGPLAATYHITLSGHANLNHLPAEGWANDCVTVSVAQASVPDDVSDS